MVSHCRYQISRWWYWLQW